MTSLEGWGSAIELRPRHLAGHRRTHGASHVITRSVPADGPGCFIRRGAWRVLGRRGGVEQRGHGAALGIRWTGKLPPGLRDVAQPGYPPRFRRHNPPPPTPPSPHLLPTLHHS